MPDTNTSFAATTEDLLKLENEKFLNKRLSMISATSSILALLLISLMFGTFSTHFLGFYAFSGCMAGGMLFGAYSKRPFFIELSTVKVSLALMVCAIFLMAIGTFVRALVSSYFALVTGGILADLGTSLLFVVITIYALIMYQRIKFESGRKIGNTWRKVIGWFIYFFFIGVISQFSVLTASVMVLFFLIALPFILASVIRSCITPKSPAD